MQINRLQDRPAIAFDRANQERYSREGGHGLEAAVSGNKATDYFVPPRKFLILSLI